MEMQNPQEDAWKVETKTNAGQEKAEIITN
jgi:hypothetical protein